MKEIAAKHYTIDERIKSYRKDAIKKFWFMVGYLKLARTEKIWQNLGHESWAAYLAQPEIGFNKRTVDNYITVLNRFLEHGVSARIHELASTRATLISPHINTENAEELIGWAKELSWGDLKNNVQELKGVVVSEKTRKGQKEKIICSACGEEFLHDVMN